MARTTRTAGLVLIALVACGRPESGAAGDLRGVEELGDPNIAALNPGDVVFVAATGKLTITLGTSETQVTLGKSVPDGALLVNGVSQLDSLNAVTMEAAAVKWIVLTANADSTMVIFDYYNGTFAPGAKPVAPALFGVSSGAQVDFGDHDNCTFKIHGTAGNDTWYAGQDDEPTPDVLISYSGVQPDIQIAGPASTQFSFSLDAGNDVFDATHAKGGTHKTLTFPVEVHGGAGNDTIIGGAGADTLFGDEGINTVDESTGEATAPFAGHAPDNIYGLTTSTTVPGVNSTTVTYANWSAQASAGVTVAIAHLADGLVAGVTDNIDDSVGVVIGSPLADTMGCSQLTDTPCLLEGGPGDDTLIPGLSNDNIEYLYGGDGDDTFAMNLVGNNVALIGGNITDIVTTKNLYTDTVDYSAATTSNQPDATIDMNGTAPVACNLTTSTTIPPCPGSPDEITSGLTGEQHTDIRSDITQARCPTGASTASAVCTVHGNNRGNWIYSGWGADHLSGGTSDDTFIIADYDPTGVYSGAASKVIVGGGGVDTADFSLRSSAVAIDLNCPVAQASCAASGRPAVSASNTLAHHNSSVADGTSTLNDSALLGAAWSALPGPTTHDNEENAASAEIGLDLQAAQAAEASFHATPTASNAGLVAADAAALTADNLTLETAISQFQAGDSAAMHGLAVSLNTDLASYVADLVSEAGFPGEGIELVNVSGAVCPASSSGPLGCAVTTGGGATTVDFNGDGPASSLVCNSSDVLTINESGLEQNCGI